MRECPQCKSRFGWTINRKNKKGFTCVCGYQDTEVPPTDEERAAQAAKMADLCMVALSFSESKALRCPHLLGPESIYGSTALLANGTVEFAADVPRVIRLCPLCTGKVHGLMLQLGGKL